VDVAAHKTGVVVIGEVDGEVIEFNEIVHTSGDLHADLNNVERRIRESAQLSQQEPFLGLLFDRRTRLRVRECIGVFRTVQCIPNLVGRLVSNILFGIRV
jgi:hypothetical protein